MNNSTEEPTDRLHRIAVDQLGFAADSFRRATRGRAYTAYIAKAHGLTNVEIAAVYKCSEATVRNLIREHKESLEALGYEAQ